MQIYNFFKLFPNLFSLFSNYFWTEYAIALKVYFPLKAQGQIYVNGVYEPNLFFGRLTTATSTFLRINRFHSYVVLIVKK